MVNIDEMQVVTDWDSREEAWAAVKDRPGELVWQRWENTFYLKYRVILNHNGQLQSWPLLFDKEQLAQCAWDVEEMKQNYFNVLLVKIDKFLKRQGVNHGEEKGG